MRCNVGVNPYYLTDQWLIAEYRELPMVIGSLRVNDWKIKSIVKTTFTLGTGHLNFFKPRLLYLAKRHEAVKKEMSNRGFKCDVLKIELSNCPTEYLNDWIPTLNDSKLIRQRLIEKLTKNKLPITWWRYMHQNLTPFNIDAYMSSILNGELYNV
jgi:deoxyribonuclease (pyrimidine dimer)